MYRIYLIMYISQEIGTFYHAGFIFQIDYLYCYTLPNLDPRWLSLQPNSKALIALHAVELFLDPEYLTAQPLKVSQFELFMLFLLGQDRFSNSIKCTAGLVPHRKAYHRTEKYGALGVHDVKFTRFLLKFCIPYLYCFFL